MKYIRLWGPVVVWMAVIFFFSSRQKVEVSPDNTINFIFFKTLHVLEYACLYVLNFRAMKYSRPSDKPIRWFIAAFCLTFLYAESDEIHQTFTPTREGRFRDVIIDAVGAGIAWITIYQLLQQIPKKLKSLLQRWQLL
jgi:VanZ family protein